MPSLGSRSRSAVSIAVAAIVAIVPVVAGTPAGAGVAPTSSVTLTTCRDQAPKIVVEGSQMARYRHPVDTATAFDAGTARWLQVGPTPVALTGKGGVCWTGGVIQGTYPSTTPWTTFARTAGFSVANPSATIDNVRVHDYGDGIRLLQGADDWMVRGAYETMIYDDCISNDKLRAGLVSQSLLDGCAVGFSAHRAPGDVTSDGSGRTVRVADSLVRLRPMASVESGRAPGRSTL